MSCGARTTRAAARSTAVSATRPRAFAARTRQHLKGAIDWTAGAADPVTATAARPCWRTTSRRKVTRSPNLQEPIGFDQLPDGRIIQTVAPRQRAPAQPGDRHDQIIADFADQPADDAARLHQLARTACTARPSTTNFAQNHWVYLYYSPQTVTDVKLSDGSIVTQTTPNTTPPNSAPIT